MNISLYVVLPIFALIMIFSDFKLTVSTIFNIVFLIIFTGVFGTLQYFLKRKHNYEFRRTFRQNFLFFSLVSILFIARMVEDRFINYDIELPQCKTRFQYAFNVLIFNAFAWQSLLVNSVMIFVKSTSDILQGVSKLDNLLKVSRI